MFNFFVSLNYRQGNCFYITGNDYNHIKNVLRMQIGEQILVSCEGTSSLCELISLDGQTAVAHILKEDYKSTELPVSLHLFQGLPKADKFELIIQKAVELGATDIYPVEMKNCVVKLDDKKKKSKVERWQSIAESAAKQSKRNIIPTVHEVLNYNEALKVAQTLDMFMVPYENAEGMKATAEALNTLTKSNSAGIFIGAEGGFTQKEIDDAIALGGKTVSLGKRILRTETAAITALSMCMLYIEINKNEEQ